jgi:acyl-CoA hydrolase
VRPEDTTEEILANLWPGTNIIVPIANGEPVALLDQLEAHASGLDGVRVHQMHALHDRPSLHGAFGDRLRHRSYFLSPVTRPRFHEGHVDLVPCHFSEVPRLLERLEGPKMVLASVAPGDRHGYFSLGTNADYVAPFIGRVPFIVEINERMPRSFGGNQIHRSQITASIEVDRPLVTVEPKAPGPLDAAIAAHVVERIPNGATLQVGIGAIPNAVLAFLRDHRDLGIHTELLSDGIVDLVEAGVVTGIHKVRRPRRIVTTFCLGTSRVYDFIHENPVVEMLRVDWVNDPRVIGSEPNFVSINATTEVDLLGQCASETISGRYWSGSGGQADFARGAMYSEGGQGFIVCQATAERGTVSRIVGQLTPGSVVTTQKNTVDNVVTEHGIAALRGCSVRERAQRLIAIAAPEWRDDLTRQARELGYL